MHELLGNTNRMIPQIQGGDWLIRFRTNPKNQEHMSLQMSEKTAGYGPSRAGWFSLAQRRPIRTPKSGWQRVTSLNITMVRRNSSPVAGDRVHWSRAHAEVIRWLEQLEIKHFELFRVHKSFSYASKAWTAVGEYSTTQGRAAFARRMAAVYEACSRESRTTFIRCAEPELGGGIDLLTTSHHDLLRSAILYRKRVFQGMGLTV